MIRATTYLTVALAMFATSVVAQDDAACREELLSFFNKVNSISRPDAGQLGRMSYTMNIVSHEPNSNITEEVDMQITNNSFAMESSQASIFSDPSAQVIINHPKRQIIIVKPQTSQMSKNKHQQLAAFQANLIKEAEAVRCEDGVYTIDISIAINNYQVENIKYYLTKDGQYFERITMSLQEGQSVNLIEMTINKFSVVNYKKQMPPVWRSFKDDNGNVKEQYQAYRIVDLR